MNKPKLKPCPCCGDRAVFDFVMGGIQEGGEYIECAGCGLTTPLMFADKSDVKQLLADLWNRRAK